MGTAGHAIHREPWNKGKLVGHKAPFKLKDIWGLRVRLQMGSRLRELALFNLGIDSKLRGCDLVGLKVRDVCHGDQVAARAIVVQHKTHRPVQFEITPAARSMTPSRSPSRRRSEAVDGDRAIPRVGAAAFNGSRMARGRTGAPGHDQTITGGSFSAAHPPVDSRLSPGWWRFASIGPSTA